MKTTLILILTMLLTSCGQTPDKNKGQNSGKNNNQHFIQMAEKIKIDGLQNALIKLKNGQTEYEFIGIHSNGIDCIYFIYEKGKFNLEFETMYEEQIPYIEKLKEFATSNNFKSIMTTYGNKPHYKSDKPASVIRIETNFSLDEMVKFGEKVQTEIFKNNKETIYEIVP